MIIRELASLTEEQFQKFDYFNDYKDTRDYFYKKANPDLIPWPLIVKLDKGWEEYLAKGRAESKYTKKQPTENINLRTAIEILADIIRLSDSLTEETCTPRAMQVVEMLDKCIEEGRELLARYGNPFGAPCARCRELEDCLGFGITTVNCLMGGYDDGPIPSLEVSAGQTFIDEAKKLLTTGDTNE